MTQKTVGDWLQQWDSADTDVSNVLRCLEEYINPDILTVLWSVVGYTSNNVRIAEVKKAYSTVMTLALDSCTRIHNPQIISYILACIKREINNYPGYRFVFAGAPHDPSRIITPEKDIFLIDGFINSKFEDGSNRSTGFRYKVITPQMIITEGIIEFAALDKSLSDVYSLKMLLPYQSEILAISSRRGHTRGSHIQATDDLVTLLEAIKIKTTVDYFSLDYSDIVDRHDKLGLFVDMDNSASWQRQGDFRMVFNDATLNRSVCYANAATSNNKMSAIELSSCQNGAMALKIIMSDDDAYNEFHDAIERVGLTTPTTQLYVSNWAYRAPKIPLLKNVYHYKSMDPKSYLFHVNGLGIESSEIEIKDWDMVYSIFSISHCNIFITLTSNRFRRFFTLTGHLPPAFTCRDTKEYRLHVPDSSEISLNKLGLLLDVVLGLDASSKVVYDELCELLNIHYLQQSKDDIEAEMARAIELQTKHFYEPLWELALAYKADFESEAPQRIPSADIFARLFKSISAKSPHYAEANLELCHHTLGLEKSREHLELAFRYAFKSKEQALIDGLYNDLCGYSITCAEKMMNIMGDEDTLVVLAGRIFDAEKKIRQLTRYVSNSNIMFAQEKQHLVGATQEVSLSL